jgi:hypothetical protein
MITRKALIDQLEAMDPNAVLLRAGERSAQHQGHAVERALARFLGDMSFGQATHCVGQGKLQANPKWFKQLYTDIAHDCHDVTPGWILYFLNWKPSAAKKTTRAQRAEQAEQRLDLLAAQDEAEMAAEERQDEAEQEAVACRWCGETCESDAVLTGTGPEGDLYWCGLRSEPSEDEDAEEAVELCADAAPGTRQDAPHKMVRACDGLEVGSIEAEIQTAINSEIWTTGKATIDGVCYTLCVGRSDSAPTREQVEAYMATHEIRNTQHGIEAAEKPQTYLVMTISYHDGREITEKVPALNVRHARHLAKLVQHTMRRRQVRKVCDFSWSIVEQYPACSSIATNAEEAASVSRHDSEFSK